MSDFITLTCPNCGGRLQITDDVERFACAFCGVEHIVRRSGGVVTLKPIVEGLAKVQVGVDKTASELAITRLGAEIARIEEQIQNLNASHYRQLAELDLESKISAQKTKPRDVAWASDIPLRKLLTGLVLLFALLFFILVILTGQGADSEDSPRSITEPSGASTADTEVSDAFAVVCCASLILMVLVPIWLLRVSFFRWRESKSSIRLRERDSQRQETERDYNRRLATLKDELLDKQRQLARHRDIVSRVD